MEDHLVVQIEEDRQEQRPEKQDSLRAGREEVVGNEMSCCFALSVPLVDAERDVPDEVGCELVSTA